MLGSSLALSLFLVVHLSALLAIGHAICYKRDPRAATAWLTFILFVPLFGSLAYFWIGINRMKRRARGLKGRGGGRAALQPAPGGRGCVAGRHPAQAFSARINGRTLSSGNSVQMLVDGEAAYPRMLRAIAAAERSISLVTYIFDNDSVGREFAEALCQAARRGVEVRVLVDAVGARYSFPSIFRRLREPGLQAARFLDTFLPWRFHYSQLRNHRKCLVCDGRLAFMGGMNIRESYLLTRRDPHATRDLHFQVEGPVVADLQGIFVGDWEFTTGERLEGEAWFPSLSAGCGGALARVVSDGPDEDFERLRWTLMGALGEARRSVRILTPYFLPDPVLISLLGLASLRGVKVEIVLPEHNNVLLVHWAARAQLWQVLERGCLVYASPRPFDHSKLLLVDDEWALVGSANWDARSLRLNFELNLEVEDQKFVRALAGEFALRRDAARPITLAEVDGRSLPARLRDGTARLFSPYL